MKAQKTTLATVLDFHGNKIAFKEIEGKTMINATQMAKPFNQKPRYWLKTQQAKDLIKTLSVWNKIHTTDLVYIKQGGTNQGTWLDEELALIFAQWLNPEFYIACNRKLKELLKQQAIALPNKYGIPATVYNGEVLYPYNLACKELGNVKYPKAGKRKQLHPQHFRKLFGRNFITSHYLDLLKGYYSYRRAMLSNQLSLQI